MTKENKITEYQDQAPVVQVAQQDPILGMIERVCSNPDFDVSKMEKLIALRDADRGAAAKQTFFESFAAMQPELLTIPKNKRVKYKNSKGDITEYNFADLAQIDKCLKPFLKTYGFGYTHSSLRTDGGQTKIITTLFHSKGHSITTEREAAADTSGGKNNIQGVGSTSSYLKRYNILDLLGISTEDEDNDGQSDTAFITREQFVWVDEALDATGSDKQAFVQKFKFASVQDIPAGKFKEVETALLSKAKAVNVKLEKFNAGN